MGYIFIISTPARDRHNTSANINGWSLDNYRANPIVHWSEPAMFSESNPDEVIGSSRIWVEGQKMYAEWFPDPTSEIATKLSKKLRNGTSFGASVNFLPIEGTYGRGAEAKGGSRETYYYKKQELLSWKIMTIPSNPECIYQKTYKEKKGIDMKEIDRKIRMLELLIENN